MTEVEDGQGTNNEDIRPSIAPDTHSFVVKIWLEETSDETRHPIWRGHITHVVSGQRRYFHTVGGISTFVGPYLVGWHIKLPLRERICLWLNRAK